VIPYRFDLARPFAGGLAQVHVNDRLGYIDPTGRYVWAPRR
jgi:hypothetical protein